MQDQQEVRGLWSVNNYSEYWETRYFVAGVAICDTIIVLHGGRFRKNSGLASTEIQYEI